MGWLRKKQGKILSSTRQVEKAKSKIKVVRTDYKQFKEDCEKLLEKCNSLLLENFELKQKNASIKMRFLKRLNYESLAAPLVVHLALSKSQVTVPVKPLIIFAVTDPGLDFVGSAFTTGAV